MRIPGRRAIGQYCYFLPRTHTSTSVQGPVAASCGSGSPPPIYGMVWYGSPPPATTSSKIQKLPPTNKLGPGSNLQSNRNGSAIIGNVMPGRIHILGK